MSKSFAPRLVSALMALLLFFTAFASFGVLKADAAIGYVPAPEGDGVTDIYYLFDYYPEIGNTDMANSYPEVDIVYDRCTNIQQVLPLIAVGIYNPIESLPAGCTVVIDIKTYKPNTEMLRDVFWYIQEGLNCKTMFVSTYQRDEFDDSIDGEPMYEYLDIFYHSTHKRLQRFCYNSNLKISDLNGTFEDTYILIDGNVVDIDTYPDLYSLCANSTFLRTLLDKLWVAVDEFHAPSTDYVAMINHLKQQHDINLLVHNSGNTFVNISDGWTLCMADGGTYSYAIGFYRLDNAFYNYLYALQSNGFGIPVILLEADPFVYSEDGLIIISDYDFEHEYGNDEESESFVDILMDLVELS